MPANGAPGCSLEVKISGVATSTSEHQEPGLEHCSDACKPVENNGDVRGAPGCSLEVKIRGLLGSRTDTQPSRLTCSRVPAPRPAGSPTCRRVRGGTVVHCG